MRVRGVPVEVVPHAELLDVLLVEGMVSLSDDVRGDAFLLRAHHRRRAVHVAPPTMSTSSPFIRWYRAKMSAGMNVETAWPRCRGPEVYGHPAQTRIFAIRGRSQKGGPV